MKDSLTVCIFALAAAAAPAEVVRDGKIVISGFSADGNEAMHDMIRFPLSKPDTADELVHKAASLYFESYHPIPRDQRIRQECEIIDLFTNNTFASLPVSVMKYKVHFISRKSCIRLIAGFESTGSDKDQLFKLASHLGKAVFLPTDEKESDLATIAEIAARMSYTREQMSENGNQAHDMSHAGELLPSEVMEEGYWNCRREYDERERYNEKLRSYRIHAIRMLHACVKNGYAQLDADEKRNLWRECLRLANATDEETALFGEL